MTLPRMQKLLNVGTVGCIPSPHSSADKHPGTYTKQSPRSAMTQVRHPVVMNHLAHLRQLTVIAVEMVMSLLRANNSISCAICRALDKCNPHLSRRPVDSTPVQDAAGEHMLTYIMRSTRRLPSRCCNARGPCRHSRCGFAFSCRGSRMGMPGLRSGEAFHPGFQAPRPRSSAPLPRWPALTRPRADTEHIRNSDAQHCRLVGFGGRSNRATLTFLRLLLVGVRARQRAPGARQATMLRRTVLH